MIVLPWWYTWNPITQELVSGHRFENYSLSYMGSSRSTCVIELDTESKQKQQTNKNAIDLILIKIYVYGNYINLFYA